MTKDKISSAVPAACLAVMTVTILSAWYIQSIGYEPCVLCLRQRIPYYAGIPVLAVLAFVEAGGARRKGVRMALRIAALAAVGASVWLSGYHVGVEEGLWEGPATCVSRSLDTTSIEAFAAQIGQTKLVSCSTPTFTILGFSLSWWNLAVSLAMSMALVMSFTRKDVSR